jgi:hypothetical protein
MGDHPAHGAAPLPAAGGSRRAVFVISLICAAQFVLQLDFSKVNVALPSIQRELGMPAAELQWIVTGYTLAFGSLLLAAAAWRTCSAGGRCWPSAWPCSGSRRWPAGSRSGRSC